MVRHRFGASALALALLAWVPSVQGGDAPLADAAEKSDQAGVRALIAQSVDVNQAQVDGMTALHWAVYLDELETARLLIDARADVKAANRYGVTPLSLACTNGDEAMVELLLEAGADPNAPLPGGESPLMTAARTGKLGPVKALLARGADVERQGTARADSPHVGVGRRARRSRRRTPEGGRRFPDAVALRLHPAVLRRARGPARRRSALAQGRGRRQRGDAAPTSVWKGAGSRDHPIGPGRRERPLRARRRTLGSRRRSERPAIGLHGPAPDDLGPQAAPGRRHRRRAPPVGDRPY